ncbi:MAG: ABC transporter substrate-binding protein [Phycisphaerae bacterium]|nr:ABC transporter substrate-binding protein [Phycisphaerae bacterium]
MVISVLAGGCATDDRCVTPLETRATSADPHAQKPFFNAREHTAQYVGPGREDAPPTGLTEVRIGWYGPDDPEHPTAGQMWLAATLAIEEANAADGYEGLPFRLVPAWSENPWGTGIKSVTRLAYEDEIWAIVGAPDGASAHLVEQVVAKARLTFINPISTDKTTNLANVPWIFSCAPGDQFLAAALAQELVARIAGGHFVVISCTDHDSRLFTAELLAALAGHQAFPLFHFEFGPGRAEFDATLESIRQVEPAAIALIAGPRDAARFLIAFRREGFREPVFMGPAGGRRLLVETAGDAAEGVVFPLLWHPTVIGKRSEHFSERFGERFHRKPDYSAAYTYDAVKLLIAAIRAAGLNRVRIRDSVRELSAWTGVSGTIAWDPTGHNQRPARLGTVRAGTIAPLEPLSASWR